MADYISTDWIDAFLDQKNGALFQFAGNRALTANDVALAAAKQFDKEGRDAQLIREKTGWFRGEDNNWRFEISDNQSTLNESALSTHTNGVTFFRGKMQDFLNHPKLYAAYPYLAKMPIAAAIDSTFDRDGRGQFTFSGVAVGRDENDAAITAQATSLDKLHQVLLHEIQHAIQEAENFNMGGSTNNVKQTYYDALVIREVELENRIKKLNLIAEPSIVDIKEIEIIEAELTHLYVAKEKTKNGDWNGAFFNKYLDLAGEREARQTAEDWKLTPEQRAKRDVFAPLVQSDKPLIVMNNSTIKNVAADLQLSPAANIILLPQKSLMRLTEAADRSSFYHESAHLFLDFEIKTGHGKRPSQFQCSILDFVGAKSLDSIGRVEHEKFARGFEQYMAEIERELEIKNSSGINKVFNTVKGWVGGVGKNCIEDKQTLSPTARKMFSELVNSAIEPEPTNLGQAEKQEQLLAMKMIQAGIYTPGEAYSCAKVISAYALAKASRDPDYPSVDRVFDHLNLDVELAQAEDLKNDIKFDFDAFNLDQLVANSHSAPAKNPVDMDTYNHDGLADAVTQTHEYDRAMAPSMF